MIIAGIAGYILIVFDPFGTDEYGLPNNHSGAPKTDLIIQNDTKTVKVSMEDILEGTTLWKQQEESNMQLYEDENIVSLYKIKDSTLNLDITGVSILDVLELGGNYFAWDLEFVSKSDENGETESITLNAGEIINETQSKSGDYPFIVLAIGGQWVSGSFNEGEWGKLALYSKNASNRIYDLERIVVRNYWTVDVTVNGKVEYKVHPYNMKQGAYTETYSYYRDDYWTFNRTYRGRSVYDLIQQTSAKDFGTWQVRIKCSDGLISPSVFLDKDPYSKSEIKNGIDTTGGRYIPRKDDDIVNKTHDHGGVGLIATDKIMCLTFAQKQHREGNPSSDIWDPSWDRMLYHGYSHGPFSVYVPGRTRGNYPKYVTEIAVIV